MFAQEKMISNEKMEEFMDLGGREFVLNIFGAYLETARRVLKKCIEALNEKDFQKISFHIHTLKGSSLNLGLTQLGEELGEFESTVYHMDEAGIQVFFKDLENKIQLITNYKQKLELEA